MPTKSVPASDRVYHHMNVMANFAIGQVRSCPDPISRERIMGLIATMTAPHAGRHVVICSHEHSDQCECDLETWSDPKNPPLICTPESDLGKLLHAGFGPDLPEHIDQVPERYSGPAGAVAWRKDVLVPFLSWADFGSDSKML